MRSATRGWVGSLGLATALILAGCGAAATNTGGGSGAGGSSSAGGKATTTGTTGGSGGGGANCKAGTAAATASGWTMLCIAYNEQVFGVANAASPTPCFDQGGNCLDPTDPAWPKPDTVAAASGVSFWFPATGGGKTAVKSAINIGPEEGGTFTQAVPAGKYKNLAILAGVGNGPGTADLEFNYTDGSKDTATVQFDDWCASSPTGSTGFMPADRWSNAGVTTTPACGVFVYQVPIPGAAKTLKQIVLTNDSANASDTEIEMLALSLQAG